MGLQTNPVSLALGDGQAGTRWQPGRGLVTVHLNLVSGAHESTPQAGIWDLQDGLCRDSEGSSILDQCTVFGMCRGKYVYRSLLGDLGLGHN